MAGGEDRRWRSLRPWDEVIRLALEDDRAPVCPGTLERKVQTRRTPEEALEVLRDFGGTGWVCATDERTVRRFTPEAPLGKLPEGTWPLCGEAVRGDESLHLTRDHEGWQLVRLARRPGDDRGILAQSRLVARDGGVLRYETAWEPEPERLGELRPACFRFLGFGDPQSKEG
jgi:hypothetical protein